MSPISDVTTGPARHPAPRAIGPAVEPCNIADLLRRAGTERPRDIALRYPRGRPRAGRVPYGEITYHELDTDSGHIAAGLRGIGLERGMRAAVMVPPGPALFALMFSLFKIGAVPVLIDPGLDRRMLRQCLDEAAPAAFIGIPLAQAARLLLGWARRTVRIVVTVGPRWFWDGFTLKDVRIRGRADAEPPLTATRPDDLAALVFTSGSTGPPKGVEYQHRHLLAQVDVIRSLIGALPREIHLATLPALALLDPALGITTVLPPMHPTRPARADPRILLDAIRQFDVTTVFGSPALLDTLSRHGEAQGIVLSSVKRVFSGGAPVAPAIVARTRRMLPADALFWVSYGATECLPLSMIESTEILEETRDATERGAGTCVGRPVPPNLVRIIRTSDEPIGEWSDDLLVAPGQIGEITVAGPLVTETYFGRPGQTALAKIREGTRVVHRTGDIGYSDDRSRLWFCGRKSQRIVTADRTLFTEQVEPIFNTHAEVFRTALVGVGAGGRQIPVLCIELERDVPAAAHARIARDLVQLAEDFPHTRGIQHVLFHRGFPVDVRHNAKIGREELAGWARRQLGIRVARTRPC